MLPAQSWMWIHVGNFLNGECLLIFLTLCKRMGREDSEIDNKINTRFNTHSQRHLQLYSKSELRLDRLKSLSRLPKSTWMENTPTLTSLGAVSKVGRFFRRDFTRSVTRRVFCVRVFSSTVASSPIVSLKCLRVGCAKTQTRKNVCVLPALIKWLEEL